MIKKFYASSTREALRQVRDALGADAIILSNRQVGNGVEIMAVSDLDAVSLAVQQAANLSAPAAQPVKDALGADGLEDTYQVPTRPASLRGKPSPPHEKPQAVEPSAPAEAADVQGGVGVQALFKEIRFLRDLVEGQLAGFAWSDMQRREPVKIEILRRLLAVGFSPALSKQLLERMPVDYDLEKGMRWIRAALLHNFKVVDPVSEVVEKGGVYALVGPTGVGKTTTVAKLAARCTLRHGPDKLALLTTDSYRIGAHDQLRIYGRILGIPVYAVKDESDLQLTLADLQNRHLVLIDTVGMSQRDRRLASQVSLLCGKGRDVKRLLLISATSQGATLEDVVRSYQGAGMEGCILTKIDEALSIGSALDVIIRHRLPLHYVTNGQRVPEDLHLANALYLVDRTFKLAQEGSPFNLAEEDYPLAMAGGVDGRMGPARDEGGGKAYGG